MRLFDPQGVMNAASAINQYRVHAGYHYPRNPETIAEAQEARAEFIPVFAPAIVHNSRHYYAIPREGSRTTPDLYEQVMRDHGLRLRACRPEWMNFRFIDRCYEVDENSPEHDRRTLYLQESTPGEIHIFSGKVVSAVKAARLVCERIARGQ